MDNLSLTSHSSKVVYTADLEDIFNNLTNIPDRTFNPHFNPIVLFITCILIFLICIAGIVGNGIVIWLLGFRIKRNPFTTYVLNLAVADIGVLISSIFASIVLIILLSSEAFSLLVVFIFACVWALMYMTDQLLLTVISVDRCVAVLFPLWHRCHRPPRLSVIVCVSMWALSLLIIGLDIFLKFANQFILLQFIVNVGICTPIMAVSTIILFVKICTQSQQRKRGKLLPVISLALFLFLIFGFPVNYNYIVIRYYGLGGTYVTPFIVAFLFTVLNCSVNPLIYFLMGRNKGQSRQSMKVALQRIFKDEGNCRGQEGPQSETQF